MTIRKVQLSAVQEFRPKLGSAGSNSKLGTLIHSWSIPSGITCPGATAACLSVCYAARGFFVMPNVNRRCTNNWHFTKTPEFEEWMIASLRSDFVRILRIHVAGDFYSLEYVRKWIRIVKASPRVQFFAYTRSWRIREMQRALGELAALPNMQLWYSADVDSGVPRRAPARVRIAWLARTDAELERIPLAGLPRVKLVFRNRRSTVKKKVRGVQVCPHETGAAGKVVQQKISCTQCRICCSAPGARVQLSHF